MNIGLESGSERIRREVLRRPNYSNKSIIKFCRQARDYSIEVCMYVLMGIPGETHADFKETIKVARDCRISSFYLNIYYPYPGTELHRMAEENGYISKETVVSERIESKLRLPGFSQKQIKREYLFFYYKMFHGRKPISNVLRMTLLSYLRMTNSSLPGMRRRVKRRIRELFVKGEG